MAAWGYFLVGRRNADPHLRPTAADGFVPLNYHVLPGIPPEVVADYRATLSLRNRCISYINEVRLDAGAFLAWLDDRDPTWPHVKLSKVKLCSLELVSGTGNIGRAFEKLGWDVRSVDINPGSTRPMLPTSSNWSTAFTGQVTFR